MDSYKPDLVEHLSQFVTENRLEQFQRVVSNRTRYITVVLEDIFQSQNASAVLRTCDCTGVQDVHIVEEQNEYEINRDVALGSDQWLSLQYFNSGMDNITVAVGALKKAGYRIVATAPHRQGTTPETFDLKKGKAALFFGTELNGLTSRALELADEYIQIPMVGFTESYNISVSAAIILFHLRRRLEHSSMDWRLGEEEKTDIMLRWFRTSIKMAEQIENKFHKDYNSTF
ncbi:MAG: RNA methyltransferase [Bacteroidales bacterium]|nr:RNA methyltransferase [Bacteroidales bacterium]